MKVDFSGVTRAVGKQMLLAKKNSPHIFFGAGIVGVVGGAVLACRATLKLEKEIDNIRLDLHETKGMKELVTSTGGEYAERDYAKDMGRAYARSAVKVAGLYAPSIVVGGIGIACLTGSHVQMTNRNAGLAASLSLVSKAFDEYRDRVKEELGEERERELYLCQQDNVIEVDGKKVKVKEVGNGTIVPWRVLFDDKSANWHSVPWQNRVFLEMQENYANIKLKSKGYLFLNDVLEMLDLPTTREGQIYGWLYNNVRGDGYVDFGYRIKENEPWEPAVWLDFNVDGPILDMI